MSESEERIFGKNQVDMAIDNLIFEGLDDLVAAVDEAEKAALEDGNDVRGIDLGRMKGILESAKKAIAAVQIEVGKREKD